MRREMPFGGLVAIQPAIHRDARGEFLETWRDRDSLATFVQDNQSRSLAVGTVRGLHFQRPPHAQAKLVRVVRGAILDVAVDIRPNFPTFGDWYGITLTEYNHRQLFIPAGFAHGFCTLGPDTIVCYRTDAYYTPSHEGIIDALDLALGIDWEMPEADLLQSEQDARARPLHSIPPVHLISVDYPS